jgi:deaminated glutathione amidase
MTAPLLACALQMRSTRSVETNLHALESMAEAAIARGATYLQSPEMSNIVTRDRAQLFDSIFPEAEDPTLKAMRALSKRREVHIHLGSLAIKDGEKIANRGFLIGPEGSVIARYDKLHLFDVDLPNGESWRESNTYHAGSCAIIAPMGTAMLGMGICYDLRFPELFSSLAAAGADILSAPACFTRQTGEAHWSVLQRARAIETGSFMISAAQGGLHEDGRETFGHSILIDPWGRVLAEAGDQPGPVFAAIDLALVQDARQRIPTLRHKRSITVQKQE